MRKMTPRRPTFQSIAPQLSSKTGSPQTPLSHKDYIVTSSRQNPKDTALTGNLKEQPPKPHSIPFERANQLEKQECGSENQYDPNLNEPNQPERQNPIHSSDYYDWFDCGSEDDDYEPLENGDSYVDIEDLVVEDHTSDEEYSTAKDKVRGCNNKFYDLAEQLPKEALEGRLCGKEKCTTSRLEKEVLTSTWPKCLSEYEESDDEIHCKTPTLLNVIIVVIELI